MFDLGGLANLPLQIWQMCKSLHFGAFSSNWHEAQKYTYMLILPNLVWPTFFKHLDKKNRENKKVCYTILPEIIQKDELK